MTCNLNIAIQCSCAVDFVYKTCHKHQITAYTLHIAIHMYSGITSGRVLDGELCILCILYIFVTHVNICV